MPENQNSNNQSSNNQNSNNQNSSNINGDIIEPGAMPTPIRAEIINENFNLDIDEND
tara:strand:+ start:1000 stop:1170 length:171 start_codon:yes stop_codon:yes gene_type:complete